MFGVACLKISEEKNNKNNCLDGRRKKLKIAFKCHVFRENERDVYRESKAS